MARSRQPPRQDLSRGRETPCPLDPRTNLMSDHLEMLEETEGMTAVIPCREDRPAPSPTARHPGDEEETFDEEEDDDVDDLDDLDEEEDDIDEEDFDDE